MEERAPLISCVLPVYNGERHLAEAVDSVLGQTLRDFELILIDDGSQDGSLGMMRAYAARDPRVRLVSRPNKGLIASLNEGIAMARGTFVARMDADDVSLPGRFAAQAALLEGRNLDICGCHYFHVDNGGKYLFAETVPLSPESLTIALSCAVPFAHGSVMIRKSALERLGLRYGMGNHRHAEDYSLWLSLHRGGARFGNVDEFLFKYRDDGSSLSNRNRSRIGRDTRRLSREFLARNRREVEAAYRAALGNTLSRKELEHLVFSAVLNLLARPRLAPLAVLRRVPRKALFLGAAKALRLYTR